MAGGVLQVREKIRQKIGNPPLLEWVLLTGTLLSVYFFPALHALSPRLVIGAIPGDIFVPLDAFWRVANGQIPHVDFYSPVGQAYFAVLYAAGLLSGGKFTLIPIASFLVFLLLSLLSFPILLARMHRTAVLAVLTYLGLLIASPRYLDVYHPTAITHLASYNRHSWAAFSVILLATFMPARANRPSNIQAICVAVLLLFLFYLKMSFFVPAIAACVSGLWLNNQESDRKTIVRSLMLVCTVLVACLLLQAATRAYLLDLLTAMRSQELDVYNPHHPGVGKLLRDLVFNQLYLISLGAAFFVLCARKTREVYRTAAGAVVALALCLITSNQAHDYAIPILPAIGLLGLARTSERESVNSPRPRTWAGGLQLKEASLVAAVFISAAPVFLSDALAIVFHWNAAHDPRLAEFDPRRTDLAWGRVEANRPVRDVLSGRLSADDYKRLWHLMYPSEFHAFLDDGLAAIRRFAPSSDKVISLSQTTYFPIATRRTPLPGGALWWDYGRTFSDKTYGEIKSQIPMANVVMVPKIAAEEDFGTTAKLRELAEPELSARFMKAGETALWEVWVKSQVQSGSPNR